jgi:hypothetical protein
MASRLKHPFQGRPTTVESEPIFRGCANKLFIFNMDMPQSSLHAGHLKSAWQTETREQNVLMLGRATDVCPKASAEKGRDFLLQSSVHPRRSEH